MCFSRFNLYAVVVLFCIVESSLHQSSSSHSPKCSDIPCNIKGDHIKFFVLGDWGGQQDEPFTTPAELNSAKGLDLIGSKENVDFYVSTGDNFYFYGVSDVHDKRFKRVFEDVFDKPAHLKVWHLIAGNHDYYGNVSAQMAYTERSWRWNYPSLYFTVNYHLNDKPFVDFVFIDTMILAGYSSNGVSKSDTPYCPTDQIAAERQWKWIEEKLSASKAPYLFLIGHFPPRSGGRHGPTMECQYEENHKTNVKEIMTDRMEVLMGRYGVTAYLAGHDHNLQHHRFKSANGHVFNYIISGVGAMDNNERARAQVGESLFIYPAVHGASVAEVFKRTDQGGFVLTTLTHSEATFTFYDGNTNLLFKSTLKPRLATS